MNPETIASIQAALAPIAAKIGQGAEYGWTTVVKQQYVYGVSDFIWAGLCAVIAITMLVVMTKTWKWAHEAGYSGDKEGYAIGFIFSTIAFVAFATFTFGWISDGVMHILNPDYFALDFFIHLAK